MNLFNNIEKLKERAKEEKIPYANAEKYVGISLFVMIGVFAIFTIYLLSTDMNKWVFGLGKYCEQLLEIFPKAQYWINNSPVYREKFVLIHVIHYLLQWIITIGITIAMIHGYKHHYNRFVIKNKFPATINCNEAIKIISAFGFCAFFLYLFFTIEQGSEFYKLYEDLDFSAYLAVADKAYNTIFGMVMTNVSHLIMPILCIFVLFRAIYHTIFCIKQRRNK